MGIADELRKLTNVFGGAVSSSLKINNIQTSHPAVQLHLSSSSLSCNHIQIASFHHKSPIGNMKIESLSLNFQFHPTIQDCNKSSN